jgi:hypothetical protein
MLLSHHHHTETQRKKPDRLKASFKNSTQVHNKIFALFIQKNSLKDLE